MNQVLLTAQLIERAAMRYTPAGLPALDVRLAHASQVDHAGQPRQISMEIHATAIGDIALELNRMEVGASAEFTGFLGKQRSGKGVMLHLSAFVSSPQSPVSN
ncbi:MAG: primosomal replication protein N [Leptothrix sp. (in: b-proteobacteria)]